MGQRTPIIRYNIKELGREHTGFSRDFLDTRAVCDAINSPAVQEYIKNRDLLGYRGHWPRAAFGMRPLEGGIKNGKVADIEPALVTTYIKAFPDGTVEHQAEFLDTAPGQIAQRMYNSKVGGFSSALSINKQTGRPEFFGFDYVNNPNITSNRGYVFDSAVCGAVFDSADAGELTVDQILEAAQRENEGGVILLLDSATRAYEASMSIIERLTVENEALLDMLAKSGGTAPVFDSVGFQLPSVISKKPASRILTEAAEFRMATLPAMQRPEANAEQKAEQQEAQRLTARILRNH